MSDIEYQELGNAGPTEKMAEDFVFTATRTLLVDYADRYNLCGALVGKIYPYAPESNATVRGFGIKPLTAEVSEGATELIEGRHHNVTGKLAAYQKAEVKVLYSNKIEPEEDKQPGKDPEENPFDPTPDPTDLKGDLFTEEITPTAEFLTLPSVKLGWSTSISTSGSPASIAEFRTLVPGEGVPMLMLGMTYSLTWYRVKPLPDIVFTALGKINEDPVTTKLFGFTFPKETLLYQPSAIRPDSKGMFTVPLRFEYRPNPSSPNEDGIITNQGWNYFWRNESQSFRKIFQYVDGVISQVIPYKPVNMIDLIFMGDFQWPIGEDPPDNWPPPP